MYDGAFEGIRYDPKDKLAVATVYALSWDTSQWAVDPPKLRSGNRRSRKKAVSLSRRAAADYLRRTAWGHEIVAVFMDASPFYPEPVLNVVTYSDANQPGLIWGRGYDTATGIWNGADFNQTEKQIKARSSGMTLVYSNPEAYQRCIDRYGRHRDGGDVMGMRRQKAKTATSKAVRTMGQFFAEQGYSVVDFQVVGQDPGAMDVVSLAMIDDGRGFQVLRVEDWSLSKERKGSVPYVAETLWSGKSRSEALRVMAVERARLLTDCSWYIPGTTDLVPGCRYAEARRWRGADAYCSRRTRPPAGRGRA